MNCPKCGNEVKEGMKFCGKCGSPISQGVVNSEPTKVFAPPASSAPRVNRAPAISTSAAPPKYEDFASVAPQEPKKDKKSKKKIWAILIPVVAIVVAIAVLVPTVIVPWWQSKNAEPVKRRSSSISAGYNTSVALKNDGTVLTAGLDDELKDEVTSWTEIVALDSSGYITAGVRKNGMVCFADNTDTEWTSDKWTGVKNISVSSGHAVGLKKDGTVIAEGANDNGECDVDGWKDIVQAEAVSGTTYAVHKNGSVLVAGEIDFESKITEWTDIISISASENIVIGLKTDGTVVVAVNDSKYEIDISNWTNIISVAVGKFHAIALKADGTVLTAGDSSNGKLETSTWEKIVDISTGDEHTIGLREDGTVVAVGSNDNGQCAIEDWKDIMIPTIEAQDGEGTTASAATSEQKAVLSPKSAVEIYMANKDVWVGAGKNEGGYYYKYTFLDLDFDGVLELMVGGSTGNYGYTKNTYYGINLNTNKVEKLEAVQPESDEGGFDGIDNLYKDKSNGKMFYYCSNFSRIGMTAGLTIFGTLCKEYEKVLEEELLYEYFSHWSDETNSEVDIKEYKAYKNGVATEITADEFNKKTDEIKNNSTDLNLTYKVVKDSDLEDKDTETQKQIFTDAYLAFGYDGFSFANLKTYDLGDSDATTTTTALSTTLEPTESDINQLEKLLTDSILFQINHFDYKTATTAFVVENIITRDISITAAYDSYFDDAITPGYDGDAYSADPLNKFSSGVSYGKFSVDNVKWICENIYHVNFDENYVSENSYIHNGYIYRDGGGAGWGQPIYSVTSYDKLSDGKYEVSIDGDWNGEYGRTDVLKFTVTVDLQMIDGERHWTFYSIEAVS